MRIVPITVDELDRVVPLAADFRVTLRGYREIQSQPDLPAAREELEDFLRSGYPVFAAEENGECIGYLVCRIEDGVLWAEHLYVRPQSRRMGAASALFAKAEEVARSLGEETVYNYVHPNNHGMIAFLRARGYTVLNLIEIRKPYPGEKTNASIRVGENQFDY